jgi:hypothetical protein
VANTAGLVGVQPHVIACLGYLSILPNVVETPREITGLQWQDVSIDEATSRFFGTLTWINTTTTAYEWEETDYYIVSHQVGEEREFIGTAFCTQYRVSGIPTSTNQIIVEAVDRKGNITSTAQLSIIT